MTTEEKLAHWQHIMNNQAMSGMNITDYCHKSHIQRSLFYTWRRKLGEKQPCARGFVELKTSGNAVNTVSGVRIRLGEKIYIEMDRGFDPSALQAVVETLIRCTG